MMDGGTPVCPKQYTSVASWCGGVRRLIPSNRKNLNLSTQHPIRKEKVFESQNAPSHPILCVPIDVPPPQITGGQELAQGKKRLLEYYKGSGKPPRKN
jgi:hypothetical protein